MGELLLKLLAEARNMAKNKLFISTVAAAVATTCIVPVGMNMSVEAATPKYSDVSESNSHYAAIMELASRGIIKGYSDGTFAPEKQVTRGQAAKMIAAVLGLDTGNGTNTGFRDVSPQNEYAGAIAALKQAGIIDGYGDGTFRPNESIKRNHMAKIITRALGLQGYGSVELPFTDLHSDYKEAISTLFEYGITTGTTATTFGGETLVTRGQLASFIVRAEKAVQAVQSHQLEVEIPVSKIVEASITIEDIENNKVKADEQEWTIGKDVQALLNEENRAALEGARIDVILVDGEIADLLFIELNTSGQQGVNVTLNGNGKTFAGNITVNADFVELKNMIVTENVVLTHRAKTNIAINQVKVKGELIIQERAPIVTASLTNVRVATQFLLRVNVTSGELEAIVLSGAVDFTSDRPIPYVTVFPSQLILNVPGVDLLELYPGQDSEISGTATIGNMILGSPEDLQRLNLQLLNQQQALLMGQQALLQNFLQQRQQQQMLDDLIRRMDLNRQAQEQAQQQTERPVDNGLRPNIGIGGSLRIENLLVGNAQAGIRLQSGVRISNVRATVPLEQLRGMIGAQPGQITNFMTATNTLVPFNTPSSNSSTDGGSSGSSSGGGTNTGIINTDLLRLQQAIVEAKSGIVEVSENGSDIAIVRQWTTLEVKTKFNKVLEEVERTATKVNVTKTEALTAYQKLQAAKHVYDTAKKQGTMELYTASLEKYISYAKQKLEELDDAIQRGEIAISDNGQDIPQAKQWIPRHVKDAFAKTIADAEKMLAKAKLESPSVANRNAKYLIASLTNMPIMLANTTLSQEVINNMSEKLEKLMNIHPLDGLQEVTAVQSLLAGKQITIPIHEITNHSRIYEEVKNLIIGQDYPLTEEQLEIDGNQVTITLHDEITYLNPETFEFTELIQASTVQLAIIPQISIGSAALTQNGLVLTASESITVEVGEILTFTVDGQDIEGTVAENLQDGSIRIEFGANDIQVDKNITIISSEKYQFILPDGRLTVV